MITGDLKPFVQGDDLSFDLRFTDDDGEPISVVGDALYFTVKENLDDADEAALIQITRQLDDDGMSNVGLVTFALSREDSNIKAGTYHYDFRWLRNASGDGDVNTQYRGNVTVLNAVTQNVG